MGFVCQMHCLKENEILKCALYLSNCFILYCKLPHPFSCFTAFIKHQYMTMQHINIFIEDIVLPPLETYARLGYLIEDTCPCFPC